MHDWVNLSKGGGNDRVFPGLAGLLQGIFRGQSPRGNPNPVLPDSFTQIYILFLIGFRIGSPKMHRRFRIGLPKMHRRFRIGPPKIHRRFRIGPPEVTLNLLLQEFHSRWILVYHGYYERKATKLHIWNRMIYTTLFPGPAVLCPPQRAHYSSWLLRSHWTGLAKHEL